MDFTAAYPSAPPPWPPSSVSEEWIDKVLGPWYFSLPISFAVFFLCLILIFRYVIPYSTSHETYYEPSSQDIERGVPRDETDDGSDESSSQDPGGVLDETDEESYTESDFFILLPTCKFECIDGVTDETLCTICLEDFMDADYITSPYDCKHIFHRNCIDTWINRGISQSLHCPNCRSVVSIKQTYITRD